MADPWKEEQERQSQELVDIIQSAIQQHADNLIAEGRQPMLNAVCGALVGAVGAMIASVEDRRIRKILRHTFERDIPRAIAMHEGKIGTTKIFVTGRRADA